MGVVNNRKDFQGIVDDGYVQDVLTADEYVCVAHVFISDHLPSQRSTKAFLTMAMDLLDQPILREKISNKFLDEAQITISSELLLVTCLLTLLWVVFTYPTISSFGISQLILLELNIAGVLTYSGCLVDSRLRIHSTSELLLIHRQ